MLQLEEILLVNKEEGNVHDKHAVAMLKADETIVGHVPRSFQEHFGIS